MVIVFSMTACVPTRQVEKTEIKVVKEDGELHGTVYIVNEKTDNMYTINTLLELEDVPDDGFELAYFYTPSDTKIIEESGKYKFSVPKEDCIISAKFKAKSSVMEKKQFRLGTKVINGSFAAGGHIFLNDYFNEGDKIVLRPLRQYDPTFSSDFKIEFSNG